MNKNQIDNQQSKDLPRAEQSQSHYTTPDGYFDTLSERIMSSLPEGMEEPELPVNWWVKLQPSLYLAACFVGLYLSFKAFDIYRSEMTREQELQSTEALVAASEAIPEDEYLAFYQDYSEGLIARQSMWEWAVGEEIDL